MTASSNFEGSEPISLTSLSASSFALFLEAVSAPYGTWIMENRIVSGLTNLAFERLYMFITSSSVGCFMLAKRFCFFDSRYFWTMPCRFRVSLKAGRSWPVSFLTAVANSSSVTWRPIFWDNWALSWVICWFTSLSVKVILSRSAACMASLSLIRTSRTCRFVSRLQFWTSLFNSAVVGMRPRRVTTLCHTYFSISVFSCFTVMGSLFVRFTNATGCRSAWATAITVEKTAKIKRKKYRFMLIPYIKTKCPRQVTRNQFGSYGCSRTALILRTPDDEDCSFWIINIPKTPVFSTCGPPQTSLENACSSCPMV